MYGLVMQTKDILDEKKIHFFIFLFYSFTSRENECYKFYF